MLKRKTGRAGAGSIAAGEVEGGALPDRVHSRLPLPVVRAAPERRQSPRRRVRPRRRGVPVTVYRYMVAEVTRVMLMSVFAISLIGSVVLAYQLARSGIRLGFLWPVLFKSLAYPLFFSLPVSFLFGITLGLGRMAADLEINAMRANGVSHLQLALPAGVLGVALAALSFYLNGQIIPAIHYEKGNLRDAILAQLEDLGSGVNRSLLLPRGGRLFVESYEGTRLRGVHLELNESISRRLARNVRRRIEETRAERSRDEGIASQARPVLLAKECDLEISSDRSEILLNLRGVKVHVPQSATGAGRRPDVFRQTISIGNFRLALPFLPKGERAKDRSWRELLDQEAELEGRVRRLREELRGRTQTTAEIVGPPDPARQRAIDETEALEREIENVDEKRRDVETEFHRRIAFGLASLSFALVGLPIILLAGLRSRLVPFFLGNILVVLPFFLLVMLGIKLGEIGVPAVISLHASNALLLGAAGYLWTRVWRK